MKFRIWAVWNEFHYGPDVVYSIHTCDSAPKTIKTNIRTCFAPPLDHITAISIDRWARWSGNIVGFVGSDGGTYFEFQLSRHPITEIHNILKVLVSLVEKNTNEKLPRYKKIRERFNIPPTVKLPPPTPVTGYYIDHKHHVAYEVKIDKWRDELTFRLYMLGKWQLPIRTSQQIVLKRHVKIDSLTLTIITVKPHDKGYYIRFPELDIPHENVLVSDRFPALIESISETLLGDKS